MQTFLPYPLFQDSVNCLDNKRLNKQRIEAIQLLEVNQGIQIKPRIFNHPACEMWRGYNESLKSYINYCIIEWKRRGCQCKANTYILQEDIQYPEWLDDERLHSSHRIALLTKDPTYYGKYKWVEKLDPNYVNFWPTRNGYEINNSI